MFHHKSMCRGIKPSQYWLRRRRRRRLMLKSRPSFQHPVPARVLSPFRWCGIITGRRAYGCNGASDQPVIASLAKLAEISRKLHEAFGCGRRLRDLAGDARSRGAAGSAVVLASTQTPPARRCCCCCCLWRSSPPVGQFLAAAVEK